MGAVTLILLISGIVYVLLPVEAMKWVRWPFAGFLLDANLVVTDTGEDGWPARQLPVPVQYPEQVTAVNGHSLTTNAEYYALLSTYKIGQQITVTLQQPPPGNIVPPEEGLPPSRTVTLTLFQFSTTDMWNQFWLVYLVGLIFFIIGCWTFAVRPAVESAQIFALFTTSAALTAGSLFDLISTHTFLRIWMTALALVGSFAAMLSFVFPHETRMVQRFPRSKWLLLLPGLIIAIWSNIWLTNGPGDWAYAIPWRYAYMLNGLTLTLAILSTLYRTVVSPSALVRQQGQIMLMGAVLAFVPVILLFINLVAQWEWHSAWLTQMVYVPPVVLYPLAIGYTIIRYRLLDVQVVLRRGLTYLLLLTLLVGALTLILSGLATASGLTMNFNDPVLLAVLILITTLLFDPLRTQLQAGLDQYVFREPVAFDKLLRAYNRELTTAVHVNSITTILTQYIHQGIPATTPHLFLFDEQQGCYHCQHETCATRLLLNSPLVAYMQTRSDTIDLVEERAWPTELLPYQAEIAELGAAALSPINDGHTLLGWVSLSPKENGQPFRNTELNYLGALADQSLIGLERANVVRRLEIRIGELDALSRFSQTLSFTIVLDDLLELVYTTYHRLFGVVNLVIYWRDSSLDLVYPVFYVADDERYTEREGRRCHPEDARIFQVMQTGQLVVDNADGYTWIAAPLNAGAEPLGVLHTIYRQPMFLDRQRQLFGVLADRTAVALDRLHTNQQLAIRAQQLEIINQVTFSLASTTDVEPLLNLILDKAIELLDTEAGTFMLSHEDTGELEFRVVRGPASKDLLHKRLPVGAGLAGRVAQSGRPEIVNQVHQDARWFSEVDASTTFQSQSILTVPMVRHNTVLGVLQVINKRNGATFTEEDQQMLMAFASQAVVAMGNARLLAQTDKALRDRVNELFLLQQLDRDLNTTLELDRVLTLALDWALRICGGTAGSIVLLNEDKTVRQQVSQGYEAELVAKWQNEREVLPGLVGRVLRSGRPYVTGNVHEEADYVPGAASTHSQLTLPILHQERLMGIVAIESDQFDAFDPYMLETAVRITTHAATAITNAILYQQVKDANQAKSEFVSMVSHELKTPMTSMRGYTDLLLSGMTGELTPQQRGFLDKIAANIDRMSRQIRDLTDISRIETGRLMMVMSATHFANVLSETLPSVQGPCDAKGIRLHLNLPPDLPPVMADKERLVQVMTNLLSNACKYSPPDTNVYVNFRTDHMNFEDNHPQRMVLCAVQDEGYGISAVDQKKLFTKFFRADDPNIRQASGTGLGLSITKGIIELHKGRIWVESELGHGTVFHFALPIA